MGIFLRIMTSKSINQHFNEFINGYIEKIKKSLSGILRLHTQIN